MMREIKVSELAEEFGVHRNTIRNWIQSGTLPARKSPGRRYLLKWEDYEKLCEKFGKIPRTPENTANTIKSSINKPPQPGLPPLRLGSNEKKLYTDPAWADVCLGCGSCANACPLSGIDELDPRKIVRMAFLGLEDRLIQANWPWKCTMCGKCEQACPMNIEIVALMRRIRSRRERHSVPGTIQKGVAACLKRGNNLGIPKEDFLKILDLIGNELTAESCPGFTTPVDKRGSRLLVTINSKVPFAEPAEMKWWWKIFHTAGESWTISSENWDGVNWGLFSGDDAAMKTITGHIVDDMERLGCEALLLPDCGHAYYATRLGLEKWFPGALKKYTVYSVFDLLLEYMVQNRISVNGSLHPGITTFHDSCHYGRKSLKAFGHGYFKEARIIGRSCCPEFIDMTPNGNGSYCCGAGGGGWALPWAEERVYYGRVKAEQIKKTGAERVLVSCPTCRDQLKTLLNKEFNLGIEVQYLWELVADSLILPKPRQQHTSNSQAP